MLLLCQMNAPVKLKLTVLLVIALAAVSLPSRAQTPDSLQIVQPAADSLKTAEPTVDSLQTVQRPAEAVKDTVCIVVRDSLCTAVKDTVCTVVRDSLYTAPRDSIRRAIRDSLRIIAPAVGVNLAWAGIATPNLSFETPLGKHFTLGVSAGLKPRIWPRWSPLDNDPQKDTKWAHLAVIPYLRWWPEESFRGFFLGADMIYAHYNIGAVQLPLGLYPELADYRFQGNFAGGGLSLGCSVWLTRHINLSLSAGAMAGYKFYLPENGAYKSLSPDGKYKCPHCSTTRIEDPNGVAVAPKLDVTIAYHLFNQKRAEKERAKAQKKK